MKVLCKIFPILIAIASCISSTPKTVSQIKVSDEVLLKQQNNDSSILKVLLSYQEIKDIISYKYADSTMKNDFLIFDNDSDKNILDIQICQFQPRLKMYHTLLLIAYNKTTEKFTITDNLDSDKAIPLENWLKKKKY